MIKEYIGVIDSGVGGLSVLKELVKKLPNENFIYRGDNSNAPYGEKGNRVLSGLCFDAISSFNEYKLKAMVVACNTLSVNVLEYVRPYFNFEIFGVYPPTLTPLIKGRKVLLLSTPKTAEKITTLKNLTVKGLPYLASEIEVGLNDINIRRHLIDCNMNFDTLILGCTHYDLIKNEFFEQLKPPQILSGVDYTVDRVVKFCQNQKSSVKYRRNEILFIGNCKKTNEIFWREVVKKGG